MQRIYLDECGYSGEDLLNVDQPVFVLCTHALTEDYCAELKAKHFSRVQATELKHSKLYVRPRQQQMVLAALEEILRDHRAALKLSVAHKEFALLMKIVDLVVETSMRQRGFNLYEGGGHVAMSNVMYICFGVDPVYRATLLRHFQHMMRERTPAACAAFLEFLKVPHSLDVIEEFRRIILGAFLHVGPARVFACGSNALDLSLAMAFHLVADWRAELGTAGFELIHDESSNMARQKELWDAIVSPDARPATVGLGNRKIEYPLCVKHTAFSRSVENAALQIADVIAGAQAYLCGSACMGREDEYTTRLAKLFGLDLPKVNVWPGDEIERWPDTPAGVEHPLDYTAEVIAKLKARES